MSVRNTTLQLPSSYFENSPKEAIKSILGNDAIVISYERVPIILPNNYIWVNVKYKCLDIDPFKIFKITETKRISNNQSRFVANVNGHYVIVKTDNDGKPFWAKLNNIKEQGYKLSSSEDFDYSIYYYANIIRSTADLFNGYCSIVMNDKLGLHGTKIEAYKELDKPLSNLIPGIDVKCDTKYEKNLLTDFKAVDNYTIKKYVYIDYWKSVDMLNIPDSIVFNASEMTPREIYKKLIDQKAIIICSKKRLNPFTFLVVPNRSCDITKEEIKILLNVLTLDALNYNEYKKDN